MPRVSRQIRIGISGWRYEPWRKTFYPDDLAQKRELEFASRHVNSIEINGTFYSLQSPASFSEWYAHTPDDFVFSVKGGRYLTHMKRLIDCRVPLANFFASGVLLLKEKLGPILWQFPPNFALDPDRFEEFFALLPRDTQAAARLAERDHEKLRLGVWTKSDAKRPLRYAVEIRHSSFADPAFIKLLRKHNIAMVVADTAGKWPMIEDVTADFAYVRLHGAEELYASGYTEAAIDYWADRVAAWNGGSEPADAKRMSHTSPKQTPRDVFVYFDNDVKVRAPYDAMSLARRLNLPSRDMTLPDKSPSETPRKSWPAVKRAGKPRSAVVSCLLAYLTRVRNNANIGFGRFEGVRCRGRKYFSTVRRIHVMKKKPINAGQVLDRRHPPTAQDVEQRARYREQMDIAQMIYDARNAAGLSQRQLAKLVGTTASVICRLENADYDGHSLTMLRRIADALNKKVELRLVPATKRQRQIHAVPA